MKKIGEQISGLLTWVTISYGIGFLTVIVNTYKLGIPVIKLLEPVYIIIGLPITVVIFLIVFFLENNQV